MTAATREAKASGIQAGHAGDLSYESEQEVGVEVVEFNGMSSQGAEGEETEKDGERDAELLPVLPVGSGMKRRVDDGTLVLFLPAELMLVVCTFAATGAVLQLRLASRRMRTLADVELRHRSRARLATFDATFDTAAAALLALEHDRLPQLRHYKTFLRNIDMNHLTEATWYASPPDEVKTVCECLCILKGLPVATVQPKRSSIGKSQSVDGSSFSSQNEPLDSSFSTLSLVTDDSVADSQSQQTVSWASLKKQMSHYSFKNWVSNLRSNVEKIPYSAIKRVEYIIMHDQMITYERLREVSRPGYSLLIVVAACLQYGNLSEDVKVKTIEVDSLGERIRLARLFLACIE
ncbi:hypothetical protein HK100_012917 [Physocladia obscura]|uniref:F-box domain-containing protein n=1 Tax=Physocladia obscura TaxID=109957 RepID=A0AAD5T1L4_9FUNG|nr:hypothetical protein HK100_012917 [Physocladia obscura]